MWIFQPKESFTRIEGIDTKSISWELIDEIYEIEQDLWGRFIWEYRECQTCSHIYSKNDVFGNMNLSQFGMDIQKNTISEIEKTLDYKEFECIKCEEETKVIFWEEFKKEIASRHEFEKSFLMLHRSADGKLLWYVDAYISDFETVYERELEHYYSKLWKQEILRRTEETLWETISEEIICLSGVGNTPDSASIKNLYQLEKAMVEEVSEYNPYLTWMYESVIGSCAHAILDICNATRLWISQIDHTWSNREYYSDIFVHKNMPLEWVKGLWSSFKSFFKANRNRIHKIKY